MTIFLYVIAGGFLLGLLPGPKPVEMNAGTQTTYIEGQGFVTETLAQNEEPMIEPDVSKWKFPADYGQELNETNKKDIQGWIED